MFYCSFPPQIKRFCRIVVKSYYSLGVVEHESYTEENNDQNQGGIFGFKNDNDTIENLKVEDYSKIIEELQSHRKEIEKLQLDMNGSSLRDNYSLAPVTGSFKAKFSNEEYFPFCPMAELHQEIDEMMEEDVSGKEDYLTAEDSYIADQGFGLKICLEQLFLLYRYKLSSDMISNLLFLIFA